MTSAIERAIRRANAQERIAVIAFLTAGYPDRARFRELLLRLREAADVVEIGVPFSDPMADGATIQRSSRAALEGGATLAWLMEALETMRSESSAPIALMSYLNPLLAAGAALAGELKSCGADGLIVPDLPLEESAEWRGALSRQGVDLISMTSPLTPPTRLQAICAKSSGFIYAATAPGTTGGAATISAPMLDYLDRVRAASNIPVCAGFGIRAREQVEKLRHHADGVIVGSALIEAIDRGDDPAAMILQLR
jgi:tryptophan synthase alpha chain